MLDFKLLNLSMLPVLSTESHLKNRCTKLELAMMATFLGSSSYLWRTFVMNLFSNLDQPLLVMWTSLWGWLLSVKTHSLSFCLPQHVGPQNLWKTCLDLIFKLPPRKLHLRSWRSTLAQREKNLLSLMFVGSGPALQHIRHLSPLMRWNRWLI